MISGEQGCQKGPGGVNWELGLKQLDEPKLGLIISLSYLRKKFAFPGICIQLALMKYACLSFDISKNSDCCN